MSSNQMTNEEKRKFVGILISQFGVAMDVNNELLPLFYIAYRSGVISELKVQSVCSKIEQAGQKMEATASNFEKQTQQNLHRLQPKQFHFTSSKQAFWFSFAWRTLPLIVVIVFISCVLGYYESVRQQKEHRELVTPFVEGSQVTEIPVSPNFNAQVIKLLEVKSLYNAEPGKEFVYDEKCKCVLVPIDYQLRH